MERTSRRILYASGAEKQLPIASTTKILTAISVIETVENLQKNVEISHEAEGVEGSSVYLKAGEFWTVEDLLYGLLLRSGNDCAVALAIFVSGSIEDFAILMNETAQKAGATQSNFINPHGLQEERHFSSAKDMCLITAYAMENDIFRQIFGAKEYAKTGWIQKNKMGKYYPYCVGGKTGYTTSAGRCLVTVANQCIDGQEMEVICTVLDCPTTYERSKILYEDAYDAYSMHEVLQKSKTVVTPYGNAVSDKDFYYPLMREEANLLSFVFLPYEKPLSLSKKQEIVCNLQIFLANHLLFSTKLYKL